MRYIYKIHTYLSLLIMIPFIIICITGSVLVYKHEINSVFKSDQMNIAIHNQAKLQRKSFDELKNLINETYPDYEIISWNIDINPFKTDIVWLVKHGQKEWQSVQVDAINARISSEILSHDEGLMGILEHIHGELLLEKVGKILVGVIGILTLIVSVTGFVIYRNFWKNLFTLRLKRIVTFMRDIHKFIGVFSTPIMLVIALTGAWWNLSFLFRPAFVQSEFTIDDKIYNKSISIDELIKRSRIDLHGFEPHFLRFPFYKGANITLYGYIKGQNFLHNEYSSYVVYDRSNGELVSKQSINDASFKEVFFSTFRKAHFGNYNQVTKFIWFAIGLAPLMLSVSGVYLWLKRFKFTRRKSEK